MSEGLQYRMNLHEEKQSVYTEILETAGNIKYLKRFFRFIQHFSWEFFIPSFWVLWTLFFYFNYISFEINGALERTLQNISLTSLYFEINGAHKKNIFSPFHKIISVWIPNNLYKIRLIKYCCGLLLNDSCPQ